MSRAERLAFIAPRYSDDAIIGGAETLLKELALCAARDGRQVTLLTTCARDHFTWANEVPPGRRASGPLMVEYFPVNEDRDLPEFKRIQSAISSGAEVTEAEMAHWMSNNVNSRALCDHLREQGGLYDRIIAGPYLFGLIYYAAQIHPEKTFLVPCLHDEPFAWLPIMQSMFDSVAGLLFNTEPERALAQRLFGVSPGKSHIVGMGLEPFDADPHAFARRHKIPGPYVVYAGRREQAKGTPMLLDFMEAFRERGQRDLWLVLMGSGPMEPSPALAPYIVDAGFVSEQEKREAMAGALAFIHPSLNESLGIVLLEAWMARTPALVHAYSDVLSWQARRSGGGLWFRHYPDFERQLGLLMDQPALRDQLGNAGRAYVEQEYTWPAVSQRLFRALDGEGE